MQILNKKSEFSVFKNPKNCKLSVFIKQTVCFYTVIVRADFWQRAKEFSLEQVELAKRKSVDPFNAKNSRESPILHHKKQENTIFPVFYYYVLLFYFLVFLQAVLILPVQSFVLQLLTEVQLM